MNREFRVLVTRVREGSLMWSVIKVLPFVGGATGAFYIKRKKMEGGEERKRR